jgi:hypothetical protein
MIKLGVCRRGKSLKKEKPDVQDGRGSLPGKLMVDGYVEKVESVMILCLLCGGVCLG